MKMAEQQELGILGCHLISLIRIKKNSNGVCVYVVFKSVSIRVGKIF